MCDSHPFRSLCCTQLASRVLFATAVSVYGVGFYVQLRDNRLPIWTQRGNDTRRWLSLSAARVFEEERGFSVAVHFPARRYAAFSWFSRARWTFPLHPCSAVERLASSAFSTCVHLSSLSAHFSYSTVAILFRPRHNTFHLATTATDTRSPACSVLCAPGYRKPTRTRAWLFYSLWFRCVASLSRSIVTGGVLTRGCTPPRARIPTWIHTHTHTFAHAATLAAPLHVYSSFFFFGLDRLARRRVRQSPLLSLRLLISFEAFHIVY